MFPDVLFQVSYPVPVAVKSDRSTWPTVVATVATTGEIVEATRFSAMVAKSLILENLGARVRRGYAAL